MNRIFYWLGIAFIVAGPPWFGYVVWRDLSHPETCVDWRRNPNVYLPMLAVVVVVGMILGGHILLSEWREYRERNSKHR